MTGTPSTNLLKREADLALRIGQRPTQGSLVAKRLGRHTFHLYASDAYVDAHPTPGPGGPLDGHDVIHFCDEMAQIPPVKWLDENATGGRVVLRTNSLLSAAEACVGGWGVAALPSFLGVDRALVRVLEQPIAYADFWLVVHPDLQHVGRVRAVIEHLTAIMAELAI